MKPLVLIILCGLGVASLPAISLQPDMSVRVTTGEGDIVACTEVMPGTPVSLEFTHSMFGGFVREHYRATSDGRLARERFVTENAAAAEYYGTDGRIRETREGYEVLAGTFVTDDLVVRVDQRGDHWLTIGDARMHLADRLPGSTQVHIQITRGCH